MCVRSVREFVCFVCLSPPLSTYHLFGVILLLTFQSGGRRRSQETMVTEGKTLMTKGKILVIKRKTLVTKGKTLVTKGKTLGIEGKTLVNWVTKGKKGGSGKESKYCK